MDYTFYEICAMFFIYGFLGWLAEVIFRGLNEGKFVNSGFLNGPICPIYGFGGVIVVLCLTPIKDNLIMLFICSSLLTSLLELVTGSALDKLFHTRWWDYSDLPFNIGGYICLKFSVMWGIVCIALMKVLHPFVIGVIRSVPLVIGCVWLIITAVMFVTDIVITVITINNLTNRARSLDEIASSIHSMSDKIGSGVYKGATAIVSTGTKILNSEEVQSVREKYTENVEELKRRRDEMKEKYSALLHEPHLLQQRILKAFPKLKMERYNEQIEKIKSRPEKDAETTEE